MGYSPDDEKLIDGLFKDLLHSCEKIVKDNSDWELIHKAFFLAKDAHKGVRRKSGEPYIIHPIAVARIVVDEIGIGVKSVVSALLHDVVEDTDFTVEDIEMMFGPKIASMVDGLTKMAGVVASNTSQQAENFRKMLLTLSDDARVILIKIADRLHNMRTLGSMPPHKQIKITSETIYLFAPLAYRLGLYTIKTELEDLSLKYRFPEQYEEIRTKLEATREIRTEFIEKFIAPIKGRLDSSGIEAEISGRVKSIYSIWSKMQRKQIPFEEVYDLFAIRIIFKPTELIPERSQCWHIYSLITDIYNPKPDRIRDWVSLPKANGYEALHSTVMGPDGIWVEVQVRSERMEEIAERGFAAHWKYKHATLSNEEDEFDKWLRNVREALNSPIEDAVDFLDNFKLTLYASEIVVFTPKGESRQLPQGATALDFAYDIHSKIGNKAIGAKINHKIASLTEPVKSGDQVEIITSENALPKIEWLEFVKTPKAKQAIKNYFKINKQEAVEQGIKMFEQKMRELRINLSGRIFQKVLPAYDCKNKEEFYARLGSGQIALDNLDNILRENAESKMSKFWVLQTVNPFKLFNGKNKEGDEPEFHIADCCNPIPGDSVIGYNNPATSKVDVHKTSCEELTRLASRHGDRITSVKWSSQKAMSYLSVIQLRGIDRVGILLDLSQLITGELNINIRELQIQSHDGIFEGSISVYVRNTEDLNLVVGKVGKIKGIEEVKRITT